jgi:hypothetical protein
MVPALHNPRYIGTHASRVWVPPFGHPWIKAHLPAPQGISQAVASFIGSYYLGIHRIPLYISILHSCISGRKTGANLLRRKVGAPTAHELRASAVNWQFVTTIPRQEK